MGEVRVPVELHNSARPECHVVVDAIVDTGAMVNWLPEDIVQQLALEQIEMIEVHYADGRADRRPICGPLTLTIGGRRMVTDAVSGPRGTTPLISVVALERLDFMVDPIEQRVKPRHPHHPNGLLPV